MAGDHPSLSIGNVDSTWRIAIVSSAWHNDCTSSLAADAHKRLLEHQIAASGILEVVTPGSFEIPLHCKALIDAGRVDGIIAFGVIVQGATHHAQTIATEAVRAIMHLQMQTGVPIINEILYVDHEEDARVRSIGPGGKGALAVDTLLSTLANLRELRC